MLVFDAVWQDQKPEKTAASAKLILLALVHNSVISCYENRALIVRKIDN